MRVVDCIDAVKRLDVVPMSEQHLSNLGKGHVKWSFPPIHPEGRKFALIALAITIILWVVGLEILGWLCLGLTIWIACFFRDPPRATRLSERFVLAPADGLITLIEQVPPPPELAGEDGLGEQSLIRVSIFMSVFDVHINRTPIAGTVKRVAYIPGKFVNADLDKASEENERQHFLVERGDGVRIGFTQIAGLVARRIVTFVKVDDIVAAGQRIGLIRFGSRVDVYLPAGTNPMVVQGQRAVAGETVLAELGRAEQIEAVMQ